MQEVKGPFPIAYGPGWNPTQSWWTNKRRFHVYCDLNSLDHLLSEVHECNQLLFWLEVAQVEDSDWPGVRACFSKEEYAIQVGMQYLQSGLPFTSIENVNWINDGDGINMEIPHPPTRAIHGNIDLFFMDDEAIRKCR